MHPEAPVHAAEALAQLPALAAVRGLRTLPAAPALHCVPLAADPDPDRDSEAAFHELYGLSSHRIWLDSPNAAMDRPDATPTADSDPDDELAEIHTKAKAILGVLGASFPG